LGAAEECAVCRAGRAAAATAVERLPGAPPGPIELCAPHAWLAVERVGAEAVRARLVPGLEHLAERVAGAGEEIARAAPLALGPFELSTPAARRARAELARRLGPGRGCAVCAAQVAAEEAAVDSVDGAMCRVHVLLAARAGGAQGALTLALSDGERGWRSVVADLDEYIRKNDYRFRDEPRGDEQRAPWRAVALVAGGRGLR
jgi:hypothetical protein